MSIALTILVLLLTGCYQETAIPVKASFSTTFINADESVPVQVGISNKSEGADTFEWTFAGAAPSSSTDENPGNILYDSPGSYTVQLTASNIDGSTDTVEKEIMVVDNISIDFSTKIIESNYPPVEVVLTNNTNGEGLTYLWTFEGGLPTTSTEQYPGNIIFETSGDHLITLEVSNGFESFSKTEIITVTSDIEAIFDWEVDFFDDDYQAPVSITMSNSSINATSYSWTFPNGTPNVSAAETPTVTFHGPGTYTISLEADNGKRVHTVTKEITVHPDTNIRTFFNIELAINSAHNTNDKGAFFSTTLRKVFKADEVNAENGAAIDIAFFGLDNSFGFNRFLSPDEVGTNGFVAIPNATHTKFINSQEICGCSASLTATEFDSMVDDDLLTALTITETPNGLLQFDSGLLPRVILFETQDGRKGAIKIKDYIANGTASYLVCDVKVQKQKR